MTTRNIDIAKELLFLIFIIGATITHAWEFDN